MTVRQETYFIIKNNYIIRNVFAGLQLLSRDKTTLFYFLFLVFVLMLGVIGPYIAPYPHGETLYASEGGILRLEPPSVAHPLGTNAAAQDVLSRVLYGARPTMITGLLGGTMIITIGMSIGLTAGYVGGWIDDLLMRITDVAYGVPLIPFAILIIAFLGVGFIESILALGLLLWRGNARVLRSQVLQIKQRPYIKAAKAAGASGPRIVLKHIFPNVASMAVLFFALGVGYTIIIQAGLAFIGVSDPTNPSWGIMLRNAYTYGSMDSALWWSVPPGILISLTVLSTFMFGRGYERIAGNVDDEAFVKVG